MSTYSATVLQDLPTQYLRLDETSGTNADDQTANNRDGTYVNGPTLNQAGALVGDSNASVDLNGSFHYMNTGYAAFAAGQSLTFEGWAYRDTAGYNMLCGSSAATNYVSLRVSDNAAGNIVVFTPDAFANITTVGTWPGLGQWVHWVFSFDPGGGSNNCQLFLNGALTLSTNAGDYLTSPGNVTWGHNSGGNSPWDGRIDEVAVYDYILSSARAKHHYNVGKGQIAVPKRRLIRPVSTPLSDAGYR